MLHLSTHWFDYVILLFQIGVESYKIVTKCTSTLQGSRPIISNKCRKIVNADMWSLERCQANSDEEGIDEDMRVLLLDLDSTRPDHLGCYGYHRNTSPNIDRIAAEGVRFDNYYTSDAPCFPSRTALMTGKFGIHNGVVGHGGTAADVRHEGITRTSATSWGRRAFQLYSAGPA